jgi:hypothetical protein
MRRLVACIVLLASLVLIAAMRGGRFTPSEHPKGINAQPNHAPSTPATKHPPSPVVLARRGAATLPRFEIVVGLIYLP